MNRLELIASLAEGSEVLCDVGCDHAYALIKALTKYNCKRGIAADISDGPLKQAYQSLSDNKLLDRCEIIKSDGFKNINSYFDTAIIAGMGGILITNILGASIEKIRGKRLILEPNSDACILREFLVKNSFKITAERAIIDMGKYYEIIVATEGNIPYSDLEIKYGPFLLKDKPIAFVNHYNTLIDNLSLLIDKIKNEDVKNEKLSLINEYKNIIK